MRLAAPLLGLLVSGCLTLPHTVEHQLVAGRVLAIHTDHPADPCSETAAACYDRARHEVFLRSPVRDHTRAHELAHAAGMMHGPWETYYTPEPMICSVVLAEAHGYKLGEAICITHRGERTVPASILEN